MKFRLLPPPVWVSLFCGGLLVQQAPAASPFVEDTFANDASSYPAPSRLFGREPLATEGFNGPWKGSVTNVIVPDTETNLEFGALRNGPGSLRVRYPGETVSRAVYRSLAPLQVGKELWTCVLLKASRQVVEGGLLASVAIVAGTPTLFGAATTSSIWPWGADAKLPGYAVGMRDGGIVLMTHSPSSGEPGREDTLLDKVAVDQVYLVIVKVTLGPSPKTEAWVCHETPSNEAALGAPGVTVASTLFTPEHPPSSVLILAQGFEGFDSSDNNVWFDALRLGPDLPSILPQAP